MLLLIVMHSSFFFKIFPPPRFLLMPYVGIDVSDDAVTFLTYSSPIGDRKILSYGKVPLDPSVMDGGDIKDEGKLISILSDIARMHGLLYAKLSIPEEKAYLFETEVPLDDARSISQNIEFKLEENIPLAVADTVFTFDLLPGNHTRPWRASVSAVPKTYIEHMMSIFRKAGIIPMSFETAPRAIARVVSYAGSGDVLVIHTMRRKTGVYIVSEHAVGFTSTISAGSTESDLSAYTDIVASEIHRVYSYWLGKTGAESRPIQKVIVIGYDAEHIAAILRTKVVESVIVSEADIWSAAFDLNKYVPPIMKVDSLEYGVAAGLAL